MAQDVGEELAGDRQAGYSDEKQEAKENRGGEEIGQGGAQRREPKDWQLIEVGVRCGWVLDVPRLPTL